MMVRVVDHKMGLSYFEAQPQNTSSNPEPKFVPSLHPSGHLVNTNELCPYFARTLSH